jgi:hypothetical protein
MTISVSATFAVAGEPAYFRSQRTVLRKSFISVNTDQSV